MKHIKNEFDNYQAMIDTLEYNCLLMRRLMLLVEEEDDPENIELLRTYFQMIISSTSLPIYKFEKMDSTLNQIYNKLNLDIDNIKEDDINDISKRIINTLKKQ